MKTSILVSGFAALCLLITFAEAPRRHSGDKINVAYTSNIAIPRIDRVTTLPGVYITADRKKEATVAVTVIHTDDFSYLKFNVNDFISDSQSSGDKTTELPVNEEYTAPALLPEPAVNQFDYLRFDVNDYIHKTWMEAEEAGGLSVAESETTDQFGYLKFDTNKYFSASGLCSEVQFELPEE